MTLFSQAHARLHGDYEELDGEVLLHASSSSKSSATSDATPFLSPLFKRPSMTTEKEKNDYLQSTYCMLFGMGTWLLVNAVYTQMPLLVLSAPEGWSLPSYFLLMVQLANVGPLLYCYIRKFNWIPDSILITAVLVLGVISVFVLAFTYNVTSVVFGSLHSVPFLICSFFMSIVGCISSVMFLPYMNRLTELYLIPYFVGEGLSGLVPSLISLFQTPGNQSSCSNETTTISDYNFTSGPYFCLMGCLMIASTVSFIFLHLHSKTPIGRIDEAQPSADPETTLSKRLYVGLLALQVVVNCFANGILPSLQSYSCMPYGTSSYHWAVNLGQIASPSIAYMAFFLPVTSLRMLIGYCAVAVACVFYEMVTAFMSPNPPLVGTTTGSMLVIFVWMCSSAMIAIIKLTIAAIFRHRRPKALLDYGIGTQLGSVFGSILSFVLVNYTNLLHSTQSCS